MIFQKRILFLLFLWFTGCAKDNIEREQDVKYFLDTSLFIQDGITTIHRSFRNELDKNLNPLDNSELFLRLKGFNKVPLEQYYRVYYQDNIPEKAELIRTRGYTYVNGMLNKDKNSTEINLGLVFKFDNKGREIYSTNIITGKICKTFYGIQYSERNCTIDNKIETIKKYYEKNKFKISLNYKNDILVQYLTFTASYDIKGKPINTVLDNLRRMYEKNFNNFNDRKKKFFQNMIIKEEEKFKNISDLNLTEEWQYIKKIDKLNGR